MFEQNTVIGRRREMIRKMVTDGLDQARAQGTLEFAEIVDFVVEQPREAAHGDFATNAAMVMAKVCHCSPRNIAALLCQYIETMIATGKSAVAQVEIAGPGFINFRMRENWLAECLREILAEGDDFGRSEAGKGQKVQVEFVSANPTGELHMGNARGAAIGDSLAGVLDLAGFQVEREFYINDAGNQIEKFGLSLDALYRTALGDEVPFPEDGYHGADLPLLIQDLVAKESDKYLALPEEQRRAALADYALGVKIADIRQALANFGVEYDVWFSERSLHQSGAVQNILDKLEQDGWLLRQDGAVWLDCQRFGIRQ
ncbi:MAG: arginine--tRNA ligase [Clostridiales bacterium]